MPALRSRFPSGAARRARLMLGIAAAGLLVSACASSSSSAAAQNSSPAPASSAESATGSATGSATAAASPAASPAVTPPGIVAVTTGGALVRLNPVTGKTEQTLVASGVFGDEVSASASGTTLYFAVKSGCAGKIEAIAAAGGTPTVIAAGSVPAISPNGNLLAYASEPDQQYGCLASSADPVSRYHLEIRNLSTGSTSALPALPAAQDSGLPAPISHLSWSADNAHLAVSISAVEDNEGWLVNLVDTTKARYYLAGTGVTAVPVTGSPTPRQSYLREGVYLPDGGLFVSRACCAGEQPGKSSRLMWEVSTNGVLTHQVAIGFATLDHLSLDASGDGKWLLYLAGGDLYVSPGGSRPHVLTDGLTAAAWD
jgi:hypothetical protein